MKNSKEYSKKIHSLYRKLNRKHPKMQKVSHEQVIDAVVHGIVSAQLREKEAEAVIEKFAGSFVDWNDLRVSRTEEIVEVLGDDTPTTRAIASTLTRVLTSIFNDYHKVSLEALKKIGKRPAKQALEKIEGISRFVVDYCMLTSLRGHAIPLTERMVDYLKSNELVDPDADEQQTEGFLAKQIPAKNGYEFYCLLRRESETARGRRKKKVKTTSKKTPKKAARKKAKK
jgi:endonuclease III